jgi:hypothetical protein
VSQSYHLNMKLPTAITIALLGFGCSSAVQPSTNGSESALSKGGSLGTLRTRNRELLLFASPSGLQVSVRNEAGATLVDRVDVEALRTIDPHLYELCRSGVATRGPYLDATYHPRNEEANGAEDRDSITHDWGSRK